MLRPILGLIIASVAVTVSQVQRSTTAPEVAPGDRSLTAAERAPFQSVERDGVRWLEHPALGIALREPGSVQVAGSVTERSMAQLSEPMRRLAQAFGFELPDGSTILIIATKAGPSSASEAELLTLRASTVAKLYGTLAEGGDGSVETSKPDIAVINGRRVARFRAVVGVDHFILRTMVFRRADAAFIADLVITTRDPSPFDAVADSLTTP